MDAEAVRIVSIFAGVICSLIIAISGSLGIHFGIKGHGINSKAGKQLQSDLEDTANKLADALKTNQDAKSIIDLKARHNAIVRKINILARKKVLDVLQ